MNTYFSIAKPQEGYFEDRNSKFFAYTSSIYEEESFKNALQKVQKLHPKATHYCYAYRIGIDKNNYRTNDDREPSGSAGRPILGQIDAFNLSNILAIVVRYYGGTNLGISGLINAYKSATKDAFEKAKIVKKEVIQNMSVSCTYLEVNDLFNFLKRHEINNWQEEYTDLCKINFDVPLSKAETLSLWLEEQHLDYQILKIK